MLEKPDIPEELIRSRLQEEFGLWAVRIAFLPVGADVNTAVYRVTTVDQIDFFLKLRRGTFDEITVTVPKYLQEQGVQAIIAPLETSAGQLWGGLFPYKMILYPFIEGKDGYQVAMSDRQWLDFGMTLQEIHSMQLPAELEQRIPRENYSPYWRDIVREHLARIEKAVYSDPTAVKMVDFMRAWRGLIAHIVERAETLGQALRERSLEYVLCHSDIHAGNLHLPSGAASNSLYIVDWDNPTFSPRERDLALIGGGEPWVGERKEALFYSGYNRNLSAAVVVDRAALAFYRYERAIEDIAAYGLQLLDSDEGGEDREQSYRYFTSSFLPNHEIEIASRTDPLQ